MTLLYHHCERGASPHSIDNIFPEMYWEKCSLAVSKVYPCVPLISSMHWHSFCIPLTHYIMHGHDCQLPVATQSLFHTPLLFSKICQCPVWGTFIHVRHMSKKKTPMSSASAKYPSICALCTFVFMSFLPLMWNPKHSLIYWCVECFRRTIVLISSDWL